MSSSFYPLGMNSYNNRLPQGGYKSWKGTGVFSNPVGITAGNIRPLTNNDPTNNAPQKFGLPRPIQHYRKGTFVPLMNDCDGQVVQNLRYVKSSTGGNLVRQMIDTPGNYSVKNNATSVQQGPPNYQELRNLTEKYSMSGDDGRIEDIKMSFNGKYQIATSVTTSDIYLSNDYGNSWIQRTDVIHTNNTTFGCALSYNGKYQLIAELSNLTDPNLIIYLSSDYGETFINSYEISSVDPSTVTIYDTISISCSGQYMTVVYIFTSQSYVLTSSDYGVTWILNLNPIPNSIVSGSMSSTGQYQSLCGVSSSDNIYISSDYGQSWSSPSITIDEQLYPIRVSVSGQYQTACSDTSINIYYSLDYGNNWNTSTFPNVPSPGNWFGLSMIGTGQYQVASSHTNIAAPDSIFLSSDYGQTWNELNTPNLNTSYNVNSICISGLGNYLSVAVQDTTNNRIFIYTSHAPFTQTDSLNACNNCLGIGMVDDWQQITDLTEKPEPETQTPLYCCNQERNALRRVRPVSTKLKKNYYITTNNYLYNRCQTFEQQQFNYLSSGNLMAKPGAPLSQNNKYKGNCNPNLEIEYAESLLPGTPPLTPSNPRGCETVQYKPNNYKYAQQGAVSSSDRLLRLNVETINTNRANIIKIRENLIKSKFFLNASGNINGEC